MIYLNLLLQVVGLALTTLMIPLLAFAGLTPRWVKMLLILVVVVPWLILS